MKQAWQTYKDKGFEVLGFNTDPKLETMTDYLKKEGFDGWPQWHLGSTHNETTKRFWVFSYPTHILVGRDGRIRGVGQFLKNDGKDPEIEKALAEEAPEGK